MKKKYPLALLGLKNEDSVIYETLIKYGNLSPTEICAKVNLYRPVVYASLSSLIEKNLVLIVPFGKRNKYRAAPPKQLKELSKEQDKIITEEIIRLEELSVDTPLPVPKVTIRQGKPAISAIYEEMVMELKKHDMYYRYHSINTDNWVSGKYITQRARLIRDAKELERYVITNEANKKRKTNKLTRHIKVLPKNHNLFTHNVGQIMYGNKTIIIDYNSETATTIESESIALFNKALFKSLFHYL